MTTESAVAQEIRQLLVEATALAAIDDSKLGSAATEMVLAALDGHEALTALLDDDRVARRPRPASSAPEPKRAYLSQLTVAGFRGIGASVTVPLSPAPGLTVVTGRNGSGKSSLVEALELALTGRTARPDTVSRDNVRTWRNRHYTGPASVTVELAIESEGVTTVGVDWPAGAEHDTFSQWVQQPTAKRQWGTDPLGWQAPLEMFRPILTYDETGRVFDRPSALFDALDRVLGLGALATASKIIKDAHTAAASLRKQADSQKSALRRLLKESGSDDARIISASKQLGKRPPDLAGLIELVTGSGSEDSAIAVLRSLAERDIPSPDTLTAAFSDLAETTARVADLAPVDSERARARLDILRAAVAYRDTAVIDCMVCGEGTLDAAWLHAARQELAAASADNRLDAAQQNRSEALRTVENLLDLVGPDLQTVDVDLPGFADYTAHRAAKPASLTGTAAAGWATRAADLLRTVVDAAGTEVRARDDIWTTYALPLADWIRAEQDAAPTDAVAADLAAAHKWVTAHSNELRAERTARIGSEAREIWGMLKQDSSVQLDDVRLEGAPGSTQRRVRLTASIDGNPDDNDAALALMSQGELNALSLALFIPRATAEQSPFRFLLLDDPIQAMDPTKVDGFVSMLQKLSQTRQVIVFSHDDRLPTAIGQLNVDATILGVTRKSQSTVSVDAIADPTKRYLADAFAFLKDPNIPDDVKVATVPALCRTAIESAARRVFYVRGYRSGLTRENLEDKWEKATEVRRRVHLASSLNFDASDDTWVGKSTNHDVRRALKFCNDGAHGALIAIDTSDVRLVEKATAALARLR